MPSETTSNTLRSAYVAMSFLGLMMIGVATTVMGPAFPLIMKEFAVPLGLLGFLASAWNVGYLLTPIGGIISDRYGEPVVLAVSLVAIGTAVGLVSQASDYLILIALFLLAAVSSAFGEVSMNSLVTKTYPKRSGFALNVLHVFFSIGAFIGPALAGLLIVTYGSWKLPYLAACIAIAPLAIVAVVLMHRTKPQREVDTSPAATRAINQTAKCLKH